MGTAVGSGVIDAYAGWIGTVGAKAQLSEKFAGHDGPHDIKQAFHRLAAVAGTSTCHLAMSPDPVFVPGVWGPYRDVLFPGYWLSEGGQSATGELILHMNQRQPYYEKADEEAKGAGQNIYDYLNAYLEKKRQGEKAPSIAYLGRHFFFYGDLFGNRSPIADPTMKGVIVGLSSDKSIDGLAIQYYATMEFIALQTRQIIEVMNKAGHQLTSIFMSGSQCLNPILMQLIANTCRMPVLIPEYVHAAVCHGAAMLGAKAASADRVTGESKSLWKIMEHMSKPARAVEPCEDEAELRLLDAKYSVFLQMASSQRRYREEVDAATGKGYAPNRSEVLLS